MDKFIEYHYILQIIYKMSSLKFSLPLKVDPMRITIRLFLFFFLIFLPLSNVGNLQGAVQDISIDRLTVEDCLLPDDHPLQEQLKYLFEYDYMFESPDHLRREGFQVSKRVHRGLMVVSHPYLKNYLIKKFDNDTSQREQLKNYLRRINGARALNKFIEKNDLQHIVVPQKWLYPLPQRFSNPKTGERSFLLIEERMDICRGGKDPHGEVARRYDDIDKEILREICIVVYYFRGLDSVLHNLPFTYEGKIAFIDTEKWEEEREGYLRRIKPFLSKENQKYASKVFQELEYQDQRAVLR